VGKGEALKETRTGKTLGKKGPAFSKGQNTLNPKGQRRPVDRERLEQLLGKSWRGKRRWKRVPKVGCQQRRRERDTRRKG